MLRAKKAIKRCEAGKWHDQMCILRSLWCEDQIGGEWCRVTMSRWGKRQQSSRQEVAWADGGDKDVEIWWIWGLLRGLGCIDIFGERFAVGSDREKEIHGFWIAKANECSCYNMWKHETQVWDCMEGGQYWRALWHSFQIRWVLIL